MEARLQLLVAVQSGAGALQSRWVLAWSLGQKGRIRLVRVARQVVDSVQARHQAALLDERERIALVWKDEPSNG